MVMPLINGDVFFIHGDVFFTNGDVFFLSETVMSFCFCGGRIIGFHGRIIAGSWADYRGFMGRLSANVLHFFVFGRAIGKSLAVVINIEVRGRIIAGSWADYCGFTGGFLAKARRFSYNSFFSVFSMFTDFRSDSIQKMRKPLNWRAAASGGFRQAPGTF